MPFYARSDGGKGCKVAGSGARHLHLTILAGEFAVCRLSPEAATIPTWAFAGHWFSLTRTDAELSVVCPAQLVPDEVRAERDWCMLRLTGPFPFDMTGALAAVLAPLAATAIPIFDLSTFDTDYVLVKTPALARAAAALREAGHQVDEDIVTLSCRGEKDTGQVGDGQRLRGESGRIRHCSGCRFQAWWGAIVQ